MKILVPFFILAIIITYSCDKSSELDEFEPAFKEKYSLKGELNGVFTEFRLDTRGQGIRALSENHDSVEISRKVSFRSLSDNSLAVHIVRKVWVPKSLLVEKDTLLNDSENLYNPQFKNFEDFKNLFQPGIYSNSEKDRIYTFITIKKSEDDFDWYFSDNHPASSFSFSIDTLLSDSQNERIYVAGRLSSVNSSNDEDIKNVISLKDLEFSANFKNEYGFESNIE